MVGQEKSDLKERKGEHWGWGRKKKQKQRKRENTERKLYNFTLEGAYIFIGDLLRKHTTTLSAQPLSSQTLPLGSGNSAQETITRSRPEVQVTGV